MARRYRTDRDASASGKKRARDNAEKAFSPKKANGTKKPEQRVLPDLSANGMKAADIRYHFQQIKGLKVKKDEANAHYSNARKRCEEAGFDPKVMTELMKIEKQDPLEVSLFFKQLDQGAAAVGIAIQQEMPFTGNGSGISRPAQIFDDGFKAGKSAKNPDTSPHEASTDAGQTWLAGWHAGQKENMAGIGKTPVAETEQATSH